MYVKAALYLDDLDTLTNLIGMDSEMVLFVDSPADWIKEQKSNFT